MLMRTRETASLRDYLVGMLNATTMLKTSLAISCKTKGAVAPRHNNCTSELVSQRNESYVHPKTCTYISIAALSVIAKNEKQPRWPSMEHPYHAIPLSNKTNEFLRHNLEESPGNYAEWKRSQSRRLHTVWFHLCGIFSMRELWEWRTREWLPGSSDVGEGWYIGERREWL